MTEQSEHLSNAQIENYGNRTSGAGPETAQRDEHQRANHQSCNDQKANDQRIDDWQINDQRIHDQQIDDLKISDLKIDDQQLNDQRVEAHLADCASCRNRLLDFHRSLFGSPTYQPEPDRPKAADPKNVLKNNSREHDSSLPSHSSLGDSPSGYLASGHSPSGHSSSGHLPLGQRSSGQKPADSSLEGAKPTDAALADSKFANPKDPADPQVRTAPTPECPSDDALRQLAAGITSDDVAAKLTQHAAICNHCGPLLRTYTEIFSDDFTPEEQAALANLQSSSAAWQKNTARQMLEASGTAAKKSADTADTSAADKQSSQQKSFKGFTTTPSGRKPFFWKWVLVPVTAAVVAVAAFSIWYAQRDTPEKVAKLEAQAFTEQRTTEMRVPYAAYADFNQKRSGDNPSRSSVPPSLNRAADKIANHLQKEPDDPQWLMLSARLDLWDSNYKAALSSLGRISDSQAIQSPEYLMTRAFALFQKSEALKESQGYSEAVDLLGKALQKKPDDPVLLFNQAIACEKIHSYECAESDWNRLLAVEKDPLWTAEARKHLDKIREKKTPEH